MNNGSYRRLNPPARNLNSPRIYICRYRILRDFEDEYRPLTERVAYQALRYGGSMMGTVPCTQEFINYRKRIISEGDNPDIHKEQSVSWTTE